MGLHDHGAAGGQCGGGVAARDREGEREVRGREVRDRAERNEHAAKIGARGRGFGGGVVEDRLEVGALAHDAGEQPQLAGGAGDLSDEAHLRRCGSPGGDPDELVARRIDGVGDRLEPAGAHVVRDRAERDRRGGGSVEHGGEVGGCGCDGGCERHGVSSALI